MYKTDISKGSKNLYLDFAMFARLYLLLLGLISFSGISQNPAIQELEQELSTAKNDSSKVVIMCDISRLYRRSDLDQSEHYTRMAYNLAARSNNPFLLSKAINSAAAIDLNRGKYDEAIVKTQKGIEILGADSVQYENNPDHILKQLGQFYNSIGTAYDYKSNYPEAIKYYLKSKTIFTSLNDLSNEAVCHNNLGICYLYLNDLDRSEKHFTRTKEIYLAQSDTSALYQVKLNLGLIRYYKEDYEQAISIFRDCANRMKKTGNLRSESNCYINIGSAYKQMGSYDSAFFYVEKGIAIDEDFGDPEGLGEDYQILAGLYKDTDQFEQAEFYYQKSLELALQIGRRGDVSTAYKALSELEEKRENYKKALEYYKTFDAYSDSLQEENNLRSIGKAEAESEFNKQIALQHAESEQKLKIQEEEKKQQRLIIYFTVGILCVILFFVYMLIKSLRQTREQKELVQEAKLEIEVKNKELTDSIRYAKRIQLALLKENEPQFANLPDHFILFQPKDIVSGDFYWTYRLGDYWYVAVADCTGHGVPGAMLTMLGTAYLNEICSGNEVLLPGKILDDLKQKITKELGQTGSQEDTKDGMDMSLIRVNLKTNEAIWTGANNPLYYIHNNELEIIKPNKQPIGYSRQIIPFDNQKIQLEKGDQFYLFSDGYADQFGGESGKKFKYSNFRKLLLKEKDESSENQKQKLLETFSQWKGDLEQLDDVCIIGVKV